MGAAFWLPYCAKVLFPFYWPAGAQAIRSAPYIARDIPIVLAHAQDDIQILHSDTRALYHLLRSQERDNVYFFEKAEGGHLWLLDKDNGPAFVRAVLARHGIGVSEVPPQSNAPQIDLSAYQPDHAPFRADYQRLARLERNHHYLSYGFLATATAAAAYAFKSRIAPLVSRALAPAAAYILSGVKQIICGAC